MTRVRNRPGVFLLTRRSTGRVFFEEVIRENLDIGRPGQVQLILVHFFVGPALRQTEHIGSLAKLGPLGASLPFRVSFPYRTDAVRGVPFHLDRGLLFIGQ